MKKIHLLEVVYAFTTAVKTQKNTFAGSRIRVHRHSKDTKNKFVTNGIRVHHYCLDIKKISYLQMVYAFTTIISLKKRNDLSQCDKSTNRGLISEDRSTEATLLFTIPRSCLSRLHRIYL